MKPDARHKCHKCLVQMAWAFMIMILLFIPFKNSALAQTYEAVIDAGSSGTRLYLYENESREGGFVLRTLLEEEPDNLKGLSRYATDTDRAGPAEIGPLLTRLRSFLVSKALLASEVSVSVLATGGMRLLDGKIAEQIYSSVKREIARHGLSERRVGTITGQEEGLYAWTDVNYLMGNFRGSQRTEGIVEVGGASAQVTFAIASPDGLGEAVQNLKIGQQAYRVLSVSYLGLGQNEARRSMLDLVRKQSGVNPCYPNSANSNVIFNAAMARGQLSAIQVSADQASFDQACFDLYARVVQETSASPINQFPIVQFQSLPDFRHTRFVLLSSTYLKLRDWDLLAHRGPDRGLLREIFARCMGPDAWQKVSSLQGTGAFAQNACANATYLYSMIFSGRGLALSSGRARVLDEINGQALTWTRGYALLVSDSHKNRSTRD